MEDLFRFFLTRPPNAVKDTDIIKVQQGSEFLDSLRAAKAAENPAKAMRAAAKRLAEQGHAMDPSDLELGRQLTALDVALDEAGSETAWTGAQVVEAIEQIFGAPVGDVAASEVLAKDQAAAETAVMAIKINSGAEGGDMAALTRALRWMTIFDRLANDPDALKAEGSVARALAAPLALPSDLFPLPRERTATARPDRPADTNTGKRFADHMARLGTLVAARDELMGLEPASLQAEPVKQSSKRVRGRRGVFSRFFRGKGPGGHPAIAVDRPQGIFALKAEVAANLSPVTKGVVSDLKINVEQQEIDRSIKLIEDEVRAVDQEIASLAPRARKKNVAKLGTGLFMIPDDIFDWFDPFPHGPGAGVPDSHGKVEPAGIADLLIVRQELKCYDALEVAHIENLLQGEFKSREHRRATTTEELVVTETETETQEERELESTDRFEMQRETNETIRNDASLDAGLTVSGSYGMAVEFESHINGAMSQSSERSTRRASAFAQEITSRSRSQVTERFKRVQSRRIVREVEETNTHQLDNRGGTGHVSGIYQWVEKTYEAQIWNYGRRTIYDFTIPEPAAFLIKALAKAEPEGSLEKPTDFTLRPNDITEYGPQSYMHWVREYEATGVEPPPELHVTVSKTFRRGPDTGEGSTPGSHNDTAELVLPKGYRAIYGNAECTWTEWESDAAVDVFIGRRIRRLTDITGWFTSLDSETESIPVGFKSFRTAQVVVGVEVQCQRTSRAYAKWQSETHTALLEAYQRQLQAYEEKLAALQAQMGVQISGRHPLANREMERDELKKACLSVLTAQHFTQFGAIETGANSLPQVDLDEAAIEGPYIRFFEQAFEWTNITYHFYGYFWGRQSEWIQRVQFEDTDPLFQNFLKAGAARVVVPVRPGFEAAIDHFMTTGKIWQGGELPDVTSELYVPIIQEIKEATGAPGQEVKQGDPWDITLPTSLVYLRPTPDLPCRERDETGAWVDMPPRPGTNMGTLSPPGGEGHDPSNGDADTIEGGGDVTLHDHDHDHS